jgi:hypothetical protein
VVCHESGVPRQKTTIRVMTTLWRWSSGGCHGPRGSDAVWLILNLLYPPAEISPSVVPSGAAIRATVGMAPRAIIGWALVASAGRNLCNFPEMIPRF